MNGNTYNEHLTIILNITGELRNQIINADNTENAKKLLRENDIYITHYY